MSGSVRNVRSEEIIEQAKRAILAYNRMRDTPIVDGDFRIVRDHSDLEMHRLGRIIHDFEKEKKRDGHVIP